MADLKISQLTDGSPVQATDQFPVNRNSTNRAVAQVAGSISPAFTGTPTLNSNSLLPAVASLEINVVITAAQFKAMTNTLATAVTLIAAPPAGSVIILDAVMMDMQYGGVAYATGIGSITLSTTDGVSLFGLSGFQIGSAFVKATSSQISYSNPSASAQPSVRLIASPILCNITNATAYTAGNSPFLVNLRYRVVSGVL